MRISGPGRVIALLYYIPLFIVVLVHELGHAVATLLFRGRIDSIRALRFEMRIRGRRSRWWRRTIRIYEKSYVAGNYGHLDHDFGTRRLGHLRNFIIAGAGYLAEWLMLGWLWCEIPWSKHGVVLLGVVFLASDLTLNSMHTFLSNGRGDDLPEMRRHMRALAKVLRS